MTLTDQQYNRWVLIGCGCFLALSVGLSFTFGYITTWIMAFVLQILLSFASCYSLLLFMDYEDNMGYAAIDMAKQINPLGRVDVFFRVYQAGVLVLLKAYWILLLCVPFLLWEARQLALGRTIVDPSRLWKDISRLKTAAQIKVGVNAIGFFIHLFFMLYSIVSTLTVTVKGAQHTA